MMGSGLVVVCFFQAEDGIRDLVRSRGLGDVYKRQAEDVELAPVLQPLGHAGHVGLDGLRDLGVIGLGPVSYTHLTLPTSDLV